MKNLLIVVALFLFSNLFGSDDIYTKRTNNYVREGAGAFYQLVTILPANEKIEIVEEKGNWLKITLQDGQTGWLAKNSISKQKQSINYQKKLSKTWSSSKASKSGLAAAIKGLKGRGVKTVKGNVDDLVALSVVTFSQIDFKYFKYEINNIESENIDELDFDDLDLEDIEYDPSISELQTGMGIASRFMDRNIVKEKRINKYINLIAATLLEKSPYYNLNFNIFIIEKGTVDGYACPGGYIFITTGAINSCRNEAELAGLIGHEIAHVIRKHGMQEMTKRRVQIKSDDVFAELDDETDDRNSEVEDDLDDMIISGYEKVVHQRLLDYELEADKISAVMCANAGYNPFGLGRIIAELASRYVKSKDVFDDSYMAPNDMSARANELKTFLDDEFEKENPGAELKNRFISYK
jgi:hypothetical protein